MRRVYYALIVLAAAVASVWLAIHYDILALARAFLTPAARWIAGTARLLGGPLWQRALVFGRPLLTNYLIRRAESPVWSVLMDGAVALIGYRFINRLYGQIHATTTHIERGYRWWKSRHRLIRWSIGSCAVFGGGFFGFGLLILPMWIPLSGRIIQSLHFLWVDRIMDRWFGPAQRRFRRTMRSNPWWRIVRRPYRVLVYWLLIAVRRTARWARRSLARARTHERYPAHPVAAADASIPVLPRAVAKQ